MKYKLILDKYKGKPKGQPKGKPKGRDKTETPYPKVSQPNQPNLPTKPKEKEESATPAFVDNPTIEEIARISDILYKQNIFLKVPKWVNTQIKRKKNPKAILHCLQSCLTHRPIDPWAYMESIMKLEDGNYNERDFQAQSNKDKADFVGIADTIIKKLKEEKK